MAAARAANETKERSEGIEIVVIVDLFYEREAGQRYQARGGGVKAALTAIAAPARVRASRLLPVFPNTLMTITIYHNPRCSKSRKTLEIIESAGVATDIVEYLENPPDAARILELAAAIGVPVRELVRQQEDVFRAAPDLPPLDDDARLAAWLAANPKALQRPLVVDDASGRAVVGRPPENVRDLLG